MILLWAILIGLAATVLRARLNHRNLTLRQLRWEWLVFFCVIPQIFVFQIPAIAKLVPESFIPPIQILSMAGLVVFASANLTVPGFWALWLGLMSNFVVIIANKGWMPISPETIIRTLPTNSTRHIEIGTRLGHTKDRIIPAAETNLAWLSDRLVLPDWIPSQVAFSLGDIFLSFGILILLWSLSQKLTVRRNNDTKICVSTTIT